MQAPDFLGTFACFYRMKHGGFFGQEEGRNVRVEGGFGSFTASGDEEPVSASLETDPAAEWLRGRPAGKPQRLVLPALGSKGIDALEYTYHHAAPTDIDVVFHFTFDPGAVTPARPVIDVAGVQAVFGLRGA